ALVASSRVTTFQILLSFTYSLCLCCLVIAFFFFNVPAPTEIYTLSLHDALPISHRHQRRVRHSARYRVKFSPDKWQPGFPDRLRSEEHTSELQSRGHLVCRLLLEKKK